MRLHNGIAQAAQERATSDSEKLADHVQAGQLVRVEQHLYGFGAGCGVQAHVFLLGDAGLRGWDFW
jgi:hypothetical protein